LLRSQVNPRTLYDIIPKWFCCEFIPQQDKDFPHGEQTEICLNKKALVWHVGAAQGLFGLFSVACNYVTL
jgi:hypothetical protein